jgi:hypothetical protein
LPDHARQVVLLNVVIACRFWAYRHEKNIKKDQKSHTMQMAHMQQVSEKNRLMAFLPMKSNQQQTEI